MIRTHTLALALFTFALMLAACGGGQPLSPAAHLGGAGGGLVSAEARWWPLAVSGEHVFLGENESLSLLDVSDPAHPRRVDETILDAPVLHLAIYEDHLLALTRNGLRVVDMQSLAVTGEYDLPESLDMRLHSDQITLLSTDRQNAQAILVTLSLKNPKKPRRLGETRLETRHLIQDLLLTAGDQLCLADANWWAGSLRLYCAEAGAQGEAAFAESPPFDGAGGVTLFEHGGALYAAVLDAAQVSLYTLPDYAPLAALPLPEDYYPEAARPASMRVAGDTLYLGDADRGLWALSLADPAHPAWEGDRVELAASARDLVAAGERIYISAFSSYGLQILDRGLNTLGVYRTLYHPYNVIWQGDLAYVFDRGVGLQVVSTTGVPAVIGTAEFEAPYGHLRLALDGGTAFAAANDLQNGRALLYAVDVSDPAAPAVAARTETPFIQSLAAADGYLYAAACEQGVLIYNAGLALLGELPSQGCSDSLLVDGNYLYLGDGAGGLAVFDLGDPAQPREIARHPWPFELPLRPVMVAADGVLYVAYDASAVGRDLPSLLVFDTSILAEITPAGSLTEPRMRAAAVQVENGRLYVADQNGWLYVFDLSNPLSPSLTAKNQSSGGEFYDLAVQGSRFLVTAGGGGMYLYEASHE